MTKKSTILCLAWLMAAGGCAQADDPAPWEPHVVAVYPHDPSAFTQGLAFDDGKLYEGTGLNGRSSIRLVDLESGQVERIAPLDRLYFGEGITILNGKLYELTWRSGIGFVYDVNTFATLDSFRYPGEGWGLANDGEHLILSDGTAVIRFLDPDDFSQVRSIEVTDDGRPVDKLNELEYINGEIWSNIWYDDRIARIDPATGNVVSWVDLSTLYPQSMRLDDGDVLNGIAYDPDANRLIVTGKNWPQIFELTPPR